MVMTMKNTMSAVRALSATLRPKDGPTSFTLISLAGTPARSASRSVTTRCLAMI
jgi:hypothetical protein